MHIRDIKLTNMRRSADGGRVLGEVILQIDAAGDLPARNMTLICDTPYSSKIRPDAMLIGDAIRQLRRLPEISMGVDRLSFEPGMRPFAHRKGHGTVDTQHSNR